MDSGQCIQPKLVQSFLLESGILVNLNQNSVNCFISGIYFSVSLYLLNLVQSEYPEPEGSHSTPSFTTLQQTTMLTNWLRKQKQKICNEREYLLYLKHKLFDTHLFIINRI